jgi:hypothetical protein
MEGRRRRGSSAVTTQRTVGTHSGEVYLKNEGNFSSSENETIYVINYFYCIIVF